MNTKVNYWRHSAQAPIHLAPYGSNRQIKQDKRYEYYRRSVIIDGVSSKAQRLNMFSRQLNQFTTTGKFRLANSINGKNQNDRLAQNSASRQRWPVAKLVPATPGKGVTMP